MHSEEKCTPQGTWGGEPWRVLVRTGHISRGTLEKFGHPRCTLGGATLGGSYDMWHAEVRDDNNETTRQRDNICWPWFAPHSHPTEHMRGQPFLFDGEQGLRHTPCSRYPCSRESPREQGLSWVTSSHHTPPTPQYLSLACTFDEYRCDLPHSMRDGLIKVDYEAKCSN